MNFSTIQFNGLKDTLAVFRPLELGEGRDLLALIMKVEVIMALEEEGECLFGRVHCNLEILWLSNNSPPLLCVV